jgi:hypothetical protein
MEKKLIRNLFKFYQVAIIAVALAFTSSILFAFVNKYERSKKNKIEIPTKKEEITMCSTSSRAMVAAVQPIASGLWNNTAIWPGGKLPTAADDVTIPAGKTVTLVGPCVAKSLTVNGTLNAVNYQPIGAWIKLETERIVVSGTNALFQIGTETQPYHANERCVITLKGSKSVSTATDYKAIIVENGGKLDLHGKERKSWTNLASTANVGSVTINLRTAVDWEVGDVIALTSTDLAKESTKSWENVDEVEISAISTDKKTLTLKQALKFKHIGGAKNYT